MFIVTFYVSNKIKKHSEGVDLFMIIKKNSHIYKKNNDQYLILVNNYTNSINFFSKDVELVWDEIKFEQTVELLYSRLIEIELNINKDELFEIIEDLVNKGMLESNVHEISWSYIYESNQLNDYINYYTDKCIPTTVNIEITNKCNLQCIHCYHDELESTLSLSEIKSILTKLKKSAIVMVVLTGGELMMVPYWRKVISFAKSMGFIVSILSNLTCMTTDDIHFIKTANIYSIRTSIYGTEYIHDTVCRKSLSFEKTLNSLKDLRHLVPNVILSANCVITNINKNAIFDIKKIFNELNINIEFSYMVLPSRKNKKPVKELLINHNDFCIFKKQGILSKPLKVNCSICSDIIRISSNGDVYGCQLLNAPIGNLKKESYLDILNGDKLIKQRQFSIDYDPEECKTCEHIEYCTKCPAYVLNNGSSDISSFCDIPCMYMNTAYGSETGMIFISEMNIEDVEQVYQVEKLSFGDLSFQKEWFINVLDDINCYYFVARQGCEIIGYCGLHKVILENKTYGKISTIAVRENHRRNGIAKSLLKKALSSAKTTNIKEIKLEVAVDNVALSLYKHFGFEVTRTLTDYYDSGDAYEMWLNTHTI